MSLKVTFFDNFRDRPGFFRRRTYGLDDRWSIRGGLLDLLEIFRTPKIDNRHLVTFHLVVHGLFVEGRVVIVFVRWEEQICSLPIVRVLFGSRIGG
jgi:hypothetical protein